jgi:hypothetical protein
MKKLSFGDTLVKYWEIVSAIGIIIFFGIVWGIRLEGKTNSNTELTAEHDKTLDKISKQLDKLVTIEELREKGLCK